MIIFKCEKCNKEFKTKYDFNRHKKRKTPCKKKNNSVLTCKFCSNNYSTKGNLDRHLNICKYANNKNIFCADFEQNYRKKTPKTLDKIMTNSSYKNAQKMKNYNGSRHKNKKNSKKIKTCVTEDKFCAIFDDANDEKNTKKSPKLRRFRHEKLTTNHYYHQPTKKTMTVPSSKKQKKSPKLRRNRNDFFISTDSDGEFYHQQSKNSMTVPLSKKQKKRAFLNGNRNEFLNSTTNPTDKTEFYHRQSNNSMTVPLSKKQKKRAFLNGNRNDFYQSFENGKKVGIDLGNDLGSDLDGMGYNENSEYYDNFVRNKDMVCHKKNRKFKCMYCFNEYSRKDSLSRHLKERCKVKEEIENKKGMVFNKLLNENENMKNEIADLKDENIKLKQVSTVTNINNINNFNNISNITNINNVSNISNLNIQLVAFGSEDRTKLKNSEIFGLLKKGFKSVPELIKRLHFDENKPENHNIYIPSMSRNYVMVFDGDEWRLVDKDETVESIFDDGRDFLVIKRDEFEEILDEKYNKQIIKFDRFNSEIDKVKTKKKEILNDIKMILYNKRTIPLKTKKSMINLDQQNI
jgi:hypothetical protein